jgi:hypothetical protein
MHQHLREIPAMRLILRLSQNNLNRADDRSGVFGGDEMSTFGVTGEVGFQKVRRRQISGERLKVYRPTVLLDPRSVAVGLYGCRRYPFSA